MVKIFPKHSRLPQKTLHWSKDFAYLLDRHHIFAVPRAVVMSFRWPTVSVTITLSHKLESELPLSACWKRLTIVEIIFRVSSLVSALVCPLLNITWCSYHTLLMHTQPYKCTKFNISILFLIHISRLPLHFVLDP